MTPPGMDTVAEVTAAITAATRAAATGGNAEVDEAAATRVQAQVQELGALWGFDDDDM